MVTHPALGSSPAVVPAQTSAAGYTMDINWVPDQASSLDRFDSPAKCLAQLPQLAAGLAAPNIAVHDAAAAALHVQVQLCCEQIDIWLRQSSLCNRQQLATPCFPRAHVSHTALAATSSKAMPDAAGFINGHDKSDDHLSQGRTDTHSMCKAWTLCLRRLLGICEAEPELLQSILQTLHFELERSYDPSLRLHFLQCLILTLPGGTNGACDSGSAGSSAGSNDNSGSTGLRLPGSTAMEEAQHELHCMAKEGLDAGVPDLLACIGLVGMSEDCHGAALNALECCILSSSLVELLAVMEELSITFPTAAHWLEALAETQAGIMRCADGEPSLHVVNAAANPTSAMAGRRLLLALLWGGRGVGLRSLKRLISALLERDALTGVCTYQHSSSSGNQAHHNNKAAGILWSLLQGFVADIVVVNRLHCTAMAEAQCAVSEAEALLPTQKPHYISPGNGCNGKVDSSDNGFVGGSCNPEDSRKCDKGAAIATTHPLRSRRDPRRLVHGLSSCYQRTSDSDVAAYRDAAYLTAAARVMDPCLLAHMLAEAPAALELLAARADLFLYDTQLGAQFVATVAPATPLCPTLACALLNGVHDALHAAAAHASTDVSPPLPTLAPRSTDAAMPPPPPPRPLQHSIRSKPAANHVHSPSSSCAAAFAAAMPPPSTATVAASIAPLQLSQSIQPVCNTSSVNDSRRIHYPGDLPRGPAVSSSRSAAQCSQRLTRAAQHSSAGMAFPGVSLPVAQMTLAATAAARTAAELPCTPPGPRIPAVTSLGRVNQVAGTAAKEINTCSSYGVSRDGASASCGSLRHVANMPAMSWDVSNGWITTPSSITACGHAFDSSLPAPSACGLLQEGDSALDTAASRDQSISQINRSSRRGSLSGSYQQRQRNSAPHVHCDEQRSGLSDGAGASITCIPSVGNSQAMTALMAARELAVEALWAITMAAPPVALLPAHSAGLPDESPKFAGGSGADVLSRQPCSSAHSVLQAAHRLVHLLLPTSHQTLSLEATQWHPHSTKPGYSASRSKVEGLSMCQTVARDTAALRTLLQQTGAVLSSYCKEQACSLTSWPSGASTVSQMPVMTAPAALTIEDVVREHLAPQQVPCSLFEVWLDALCDAALLLLTTAAQVCQDAGQRCFRVDSNANPYKNTGGTGISNLQFADLVGLAGSLTTGHDIQIVLQPLAELVECMFTSLSAAHHCSSNSSSKMRSQAACPVWPENGARYISAATERCYNLLGALVARSVESGPVALPPALLPAQPPSTTEHHAAPSAVTLTCMPPHTAPMLWPLLHIASLRLHMQLLTIFVADLSAVPLAIAAAVLTSARRHASCSSCVSGRSAHNPNFSTLAGLHHVSSVQAAALGMLKHHMELLEQLKAWERSLAAQTTPATAGPVAAAAALAAVAAMPLPVHVSSLCSIGSATALRGPTYSSECRDATGPDTFARPVKRAKSRFYVRRAEERAASPQPLPFQGVPASRTWLPTVLQPHVPIWQLSATSMAGLLTALVANIQPGHQVYPNVSSGQADHELCQGLELLTYCQTQTRLHLHKFLPALGSAACSAGSSRTGSSSQSMTQLEVLQALGQSAINAYHTACKVLDGGVKPGPGAADATISGLQQMLLPSAGLATMPSAVAAAATVRSALGLLTAVFKTLACSDGTAATASPTASQGAPAGSAAHCSTGLLPELLLEHLVAASSFPAVQALHEEVLLAPAQSAGRQISELATGTAGRAAGAAAGRTGRAGLPTFRTGMLADTASMPGGREGTPASTVDVSPIVLNALTCSSDIIPGVAPATESCTRFGIMENLASMLTDRRARSVAAGKAAKVADPSIGVVTWRMTCKLAEEQPLSGTLLWLLVQVQAIYKVQVEAGSASLAHTGLDEAGPTRSSRQRTHGLQHVLTCRGHPQAGKTDAPKLAHHHHQQPQTRTGQSDDTGDSSTGLAASAVTAAPTDTVAAAALGIVRRALCLAEVLAACCTAQELDTTQCGRLTLRELCCETAHALLADCPALLPACCPDLLIKIACGWAGATDDSALLASSLLAQVIQGDGFVIQCPALLPNGTSSADWAKGLPNAYKLRLVMRLCRTLRQGLHSNAKLQQCKQQRSGQARQQQQEGPELDAGCPLGNGGNQTTLEEEEDEKGEGEPMSTQAVHQSVAALLNASEWLAATAASMPDLPPAARQQAVVYAATALHECLQCCGRAALRLQHALVSTRVPLGSTGNAAVLLPDAESSSCAMLVALGMLCRSRPQEAVQQLLQQLVVEGHADGTQQALLSPCAGNAAKPQATTARRQLRDLYHVAAMFDAAKVTMVGQLMRPTAQQQLAAGMQQHTTRPQPTADATRVKMHLLAALRIIDTIDEDLHRAATSGPTSGNAATIADIGAGDETASAPVKLTCPHGETAEGEELIYEPDLLARTSSGSSSDSHSGAGNGDSSGTSDEDSGCIVPVTAAGTVEDPAGCDCPNNVQVAMQADPPGTRQGGVSGTGRTGSPAALLCTAAFASPKGRAEADCFGGTSAAARCAVSVKVCPVGTSVCGLAALSFTAAAPPTTPTCSPAAAPSTTSAVMLPPRVLPPTRRRVALAPLPRVVAACVDQQISKGGTGSGGGVEYGSVRGGSGSAAGFASSDQSAATHAQNRPGTPTAVPVALPCVHTCVPRPTVAPWPLGSDLPPDVVHAALAEGCLPRQVPCKGAEDASPRSCPQHQQRQTRNMQQDKQQQAVLTGGLLQVPAKQLLQQRQQSQVDGAPLHSSSRLQTQRQLRYLPDTNITDSSKNGCSKGNASGGMTPLSRHAPTALPCRQPLSHPPPSLLMSTQQHADDRTRSLNEREGQWGWLPARTHQQQETNRQAARGGLTKAGRSQLAAAQQRAGTVMSSRCTAWMKDLDVNAATYSSDDLDADFDLPAANSSAKKIQQGQYRWQQCSMRHTSLLSNVQAAAGVRGPALPLPLASLATKQLISRGKGKALSQCQPQPSPPSGSTEFLRKRPRSQPRCEPCVLPGAQAWSFGSLPHKVRATAVHNEQVSAPAKNSLGMKASKSSQDCDDEANTEPAHLAPLPEPAASVAVLRTKQKRIRARVLRRTKAKNAWLVACMDEMAAHTESSNDDSGFTDLEDFVVCQPNRDYATLIKQRFAYRGSNVKDLEFLRDEEAEREGDAVVRAMTSAAQRCPSVPHQQPRLGSLRRHAHQVWSSSRG